MAARIVFTKKELKEAIKDNVEFITVSGDLAKKIHRTKLFGKCGNKTSKWEGKDSVCDAAAMAAFTGIEIAIIIIAISVGLGLIISLWKNYEEVDVELETNPPKVKFKAKRQ